MGILWGVVGGPQNVQGNAGQGAFEDENRVDLRHFGGQMIFSLAGHLGSP